MVSLEGHLIYRSGEAILGLPIKDILRIYYHTDFTISEGIAYVNDNSPVSKRNLTLLDSRDFIPTKEGTFVGFEQEKQNLIRELKLREQDHINWVKTLEDCISNGGEFTLSTDPHTCAFGKWYDKFETDDYLLDQILGKFDKPHKDIHKLGIEAISLRDKGETGKAEALIEKQKETTLASLINLFQDLYQAINQSNTRKVILFRDDKKKGTGIIVDNVLKIQERCKENIKVSTLLNSRFIETEEFGIVPLFNLDPQYQDPN